VKGEKRRNENKIFEYLRAAILGDSARDEDIGMGIDVVIML